ncbi:MAG: hypothetical protein ACOYNL_05265 [Rickettsiales bacterium]
MADQEKQSNFENLKPEERAAVDWKANDNLAKQQKAGDTFAQNNPAGYLANARESIAAPENSDGVRQLVEQYKREIGGAPKLS